jgi:hypothetical protein
MPSTTLKFDVFGRFMVAERTGSGWKLFDVGHEGKRMLVTDVVVPGFISPSEIDQYLADIYHEWASDKHPAVKRLSE